jgi:hypothetical protein
VIFSTEPKSDTCDRLLEFLDAASVRLRADFACLHLMTRAEYQRGRSDKAVRASDKTQQLLLIADAGKTILTQ